MTPVRLHVLFSTYLQIEDARLLLEDGTEIDDEYLAACDEYTVFTVLKSSENIKYISTKAKENVRRLAADLASPSKDVLKAYQSCKAELMSHVLQIIESLEVPNHLLLADSKQHHEEWFKGN